MAGRYLMLFACIFFSSCKTQNSNPNGPDSLEHITAHQRLIESNALAKSIVDDVSFIGIYTNESSTEGKSTSWQYRYFSVKQNKTIYITATTRKIRYDSSSAAIFGISTIVRSWINSDSAVYIANKSGYWNFVTHPDCKMIIFLYEPLVPNSYPIWEITYYIIGSKLRETVKVNALTGEIIQ